MKAQWQDLLPEYYAVHFGIASWMPQSPKRERRREIIEALL